MSLGIGQRRLRPGELRFRLSELRGEGPGIDHKQQLALPDVFTVAEIHRLQQAGDARPHLHRIHRFEAAGVVVPIGHLPLHRMGNGYGRRRRLRDGRRPVTSSRQYGEPCPYSDGRDFPGPVSGFLQNSRPLSDNPPSQHFDGIEAARNCRAHL